MKENDLEDKKDRELNGVIIFAIIMSLLITFLFISIRVQGQERVELLPYGDFEHWAEMQIAESKLIGGQTKTLYKIGGIWGSSNAHARAFGVDKVSVSVSPEKREIGYCCKMECRIEEVSAIGINFKALATGSIFTGNMIDVVGLKQSTDPNSAIDMGVPFSARPSALILDYKAIIHKSPAIYAPAKTEVKAVGGYDKGEITLLLQHRWEENGHVYAYRVGTAMEYISQTTDWRNDYRIPIVYGRTAKVYKELSKDDHKTHNSKGQMVFIEEVDFREDVEPTHLIIMISAGSMPPFTGCPGNTVWCDNIRLEYSDK